MFHLEAVKLARVGAREGAGQCKGRSCYGECLTFRFEVCILKPETRLDTVFTVCLDKTIISNLDLRFKFFVVRFVSLLDIWL